MLRPSVLFVVLACLAPTNVFASDHHFHSHHAGGDSGGGCGGGEPEASPPPIAPSVDASKHVFVTSSRFSAELGGVAGADASCQSVATRAGLLGTYRAWLSFASSDGTGDARSRIAGAGAYVTMNAFTVFADGPGRGAPLATLTDERGRLATGDDARVGVWSGSDASGHADGLDCAGWTSTTSDGEASIGDGTANDVNWGGGNLRKPCSAYASLICFEE